MRVAILGTSAIAHKHAQAYRNIGYDLVACANRDAAKGRAFAAQWNTRFIDRWQDLCALPDIDFVDLCTLPAFRLEAVEACAANRKHIQIQKPIAADLATARRMIDIANAAGILIGIVSQHRFDESSQFLKRALIEGRLGRILQADAYIKWFRSDAYYAPPAKGTWAGEGGGVLINQGIHSIDVLRWMMGPVHSVDAQWQLGAIHNIESEDIVNALLRYESGASGVIQASTAFWPGEPERIEIHGTKGWATIAGDKLVRWDVQGDSGEPAPVSQSSSSGASDPMAISLAPFEAKFLDFGRAITEHREPLISGEEGYRALEVVEAIYRSCRADARVMLKSTGND